MQGFVFVSRKPPRQPAERANAGATEARKIKKKKKKKKRGKMKEDADRSPREDDAKARNRKKRHVSVVATIQKNLFSEEEIDVAVCQICGCEGDTSRLLLCDWCDAGYHTGCLRPSLDRVPSNDWYCPKCIAPREGFDEIAAKRGAGKHKGKHEKTGPTEPESVIRGENDSSNHEGSDEDTGTLSDEERCQICARADWAEVMMLCDECDKGYHTHCLYPPLSEIPKGTWIGPCCSSGSSSKA
uniref:PHD-type domain-containing protein n=1 Tax=Bigelowiella natans TaxID=227086 RepID=A0A6T7GSI3_BIGNA|mmetsp:Transcript_1230/g.1877  ORF Transcript_1230/g.1877 Transcript_1230/m.1877 type:complete len:242 (+) Transcript_1230:335-1060(+)